MKKIIFVKIIIIFSLLISLIFSNADAGNKAVFHEDVYNGASFNWEVTKWNIVERISPSSYTFFKLGDEIRMEINDTLPEELIIWEYHLPAGAFWAKWFKNDVEFNPLDADGLWYPYIHSFIFPISLIQDNVTSDYFRFYSDLVDAIDNPNLQTTQKLGSRYYEITYEFSDGTYSIEHYRKYDKETGVLVQYRGTVDYPAANTSLEIEFSTTDYETVSVNLPLITTIIPLMILTIIIKKKRKVS